jgi:hypothetical protein
MSGNGVPDVQCPGPWRLLQTVFPVCSSYATRYRSPCSKGAPIQVGLFFLLKLNIKLHLHIRQNPGFSMLIHFCVSLQITNSNKRHAQSISKVHASNPVLIFCFRGKTYFSFKNFLAIFAETL